MNPSRNLFLIGPTGAGKTTLGRHLSEHYGLPLCDLDQAIEQQAGIDIPRIFELEGEAGFRRRESRLLDTLSTQSPSMLVTGAGCVLDPDNRRRLHERGFVLWLDCTPELQLARLAQERQRPLLNVADRPASLAAMAKLRTPLYREIADLYFPSQYENPAHAVQRCLILLESHWQRIS